MRVAPALAVSILLAIPAVAAAAPDGSTGLVDRPSGFGALPFDGVSGSDIGTWTISADGCFVAFESENDALFSGDENDSGNIFRKDHCSPGHPLEQVNVTLTRTRAKQGLNHVTFSGRTKHGRLRAGHDRATVRATDAAGNRSKARTVTFTVVRR